jgi:hypothetical protein
MLQRSVVDRWVQSDHIFLIHSCRETLPFGTKGHKSFREDAYVLGGIIVVLHYKICLEWRQRTALHILHRPAMLC